jgi:hypothetical protein
MKLALLKLFLASLAITSFALTAGCSSDPTTAENEDDPAEDVGVSTEELNSLSQQFVGEYEWQAASSGTFVDFKKVNFKSDGKYTASVDSGLVNPNVVCFAFPCTLPESGTWHAYRSFGRVKIRVNPTGPKPSRSYFASASSVEHSIKLTRFGQTTKLFKVSSATCANVLCAPNTNCVIQNGSPTCVPILTCETVLCAPGSTCSMVNGQPQCQSPPCIKTGCSSHVCADHDVITTCEWQPDYACYAQAECKRQLNGQCGFTQTPALQACLANN